MMDRPRKRYLLDDYQLEPDKQLLSRGGQQVRLPKKPFQVLLYLIEHRDRYVSRTELLDTFWDGREVYDDALRKCVGAIRKALDDPSDNPRFVETRWGVGYRYIGPVAEQVVREETAITEIEKTRGIKIVVEEEEIQDDAAIAEKAAVNISPAPARRLPLLLKRHPKITALALIFLAAAIASAVIVTVRRRPAISETSAPPIRSIAVLPFRNLTNDPADEYLSDGITESLITALSRVQGLKIISRSSVFTLKGKEVDPREIGRQLDVAAVLEGSVRRNNDQVHVDVWLVSTEDASVLWSGDINDRAISDILAVENEIASNVATGLRLKLGREGEQRLAKRYTDNAEAYDAYLKGRYFLNKRTIEGTTKAIEYFERAIEIDPKYALSYAALAESYDKSYWFMDLRPQEVLAREKEAASRAIALDDSLAEAHVAMATVYANEWKLPDAAREEERAIEIDPGNAEAHHNYAYRLIDLLRPDEAVSEIKLARDLDPLNLVMHVDVGQILTFARRYDEAIAALRYAVEMESHSTNAHWNLAVAYELKGMKAEAVAEYIKALTLGDESREAMELKKAYESGGVKGFWQKRLEQLQSRPGHVEPTDLALIYIKFGDKDRAFTWLEKAYEERSPHLVCLNSSPWFDALRSDPRYTDLLRRTGLYVENQTAFMSSTTVPQSYNP